MDLWYFSTLSRKANFFDDLVKRFTESEGQARDRGRSFQIAKLLRNRLASDIRR